MDDKDFEMLVDLYYKPLFRFAHSLAGSEDHAADLTQQTFLQWARKNEQLRDRSKAKTWLFTTLYRAFLQTARHKTAAPHVPLEDAESELPPLAATQVDSMDAADVLSALQALEPAYREVIALFYMQDMAYKEIADVLGIPIGTVMSRISRGKALLRKALHVEATAL